MALKGKELGMEGERVAALFLQKQGMAIARDKKDLVFVEVKTRSGTEFGSTLEAVDPRKCRQIVRVAQEYLLQNDGFEQPARFDVIGILIGDSVQIEHVKNAFDS